MIFKIRLDGLEVFGYHGVQQHEKDYGQNFLIDCHLDVDAGNEDNIDSTVSYALVAGSGLRPGSAHPEGNFDRSQTPRSAHPGLQRCVRDSLRSQG